MPAGDIANLQVMAKADPGFTAAPELHRLHIVEDLAKWKKRKSLVGTGHCPVQTQLASGAPKVKFRRKDPIVRADRMRLKSAAWVKMLATNGVVSHGVV